MLCQNCGQREANVKYTQIINGVKKEMTLCDICAKELGLEDIHVNMPIDFSSFLGDFLEPYQNEGFIPTMLHPQSLLCDNCHMSFDDFIKEGKFGCSHCYDVFADRIDPLLKNIHGANRHVGRLQKVLQNPEEKQQVKEKAENKQEKVKKDTKQEQIEQLKNRLKEEIAQERYEDAAKTRDEIKKLEK
ncbi:MAG: hypothetical protein ACLTEH_00045 [Clostridia bacterium]